MWNRDHKQSQEFEATCDSQHFCTLNTPHMSPQKQAERLCVREEASSELAYAPKPLSNYAVGLFMVFTFCQGIFQFVFTFLIFRPSRFLRI